jgi:hypothetical protein
LPTFNPDFRFALIRAEPRVARRHAEVALARSESLGQELRSVVLAELKAPGYHIDEADVDIAHQEISYVEDELPRLELYGILFVLFATFESVVKRLPSYIGAWTAADVTCAKRGDFLASAERFYRHELGVPLFSSHEQEQAIRLVADVRHAIAHATGQVSMLRRRLRTRLEQALRKEPRVAIVDGNLRLEPEYVRLTAHELEQVVNELIGRLEAGH